MAEIERKFLVAEMPRAESAAATIEQGYLALDERGEVRLRRIDGELLLTAKSGHGEVREEVEVAIHPRAFEALWPLTAGRRVRKVRHYVPLGEGLRAEVDVYEGALDGLRTAEVEFGSRAEADAFAPPPWLGAELTGDPRYSNQTLATAGLPAAGATRDDVRMETTQYGAEAAERAGGEAAEPAPSRAYRLLADEGAADGVRRAIASRLDKAAGRLREARETGADGDALAEAIHGVRKDLKKARAALRLVREDLGEKTFKRENRALRDAARTLSASRDAEVKLATLDALAAGDGVKSAAGDAPAAGAGVKSAAGDAPAAGAGVKSAAGDGPAAGADDVPPAATARWREALVADRDRIVGGEGGGTEDALAAIEAVAARGPEWKLRADGWKLLSPGLDTAYREGREAFTALGDPPTFEAVHDLRKRGKDLWYQLRLLRDAWQPVLEPTVEEIHDFTDQLGDHHDLAILSLDLDGREDLDAADRETLRRLIEARQASLLAEAVAAGERIYAERPKAFNRRIRAYWRAWRA